MDALDVADVEFSSENNGYDMVIHHTDAYELPFELKSRLKEARQNSAFANAKLEHDFSQFTADCVQHFRKKNASKAQFIASHGVTIFHQPEKGYTQQIGSGAIISSRTDLPVVCDFRQQDISLGGQGAPLVPFCDQHLFSEYRATLNLGGFANISLLQEPLLGYDICGCNLLLNEIASWYNLSYDKDGDLASKGKVEPTMLRMLNEIDYFQLPPPKSLGAEWISKSIIPILLVFDHIPKKDLLRTYVEHISMQISRHLDFEGKCLVTGGGAHNVFLLDRICLTCKAEIVKPADELINFREAVCFAFLGFLRLQNLPNTSISVTGAAKPISAGAVYLP